MALRRLLRESDIVLFTAPILKCRADDRVGAPVTVGDHGRAGRRQGLSTSKIRFRRWCYASTAW